MPHILAGALVGGLIGAGSYLVKAAGSGNFSWKSLGAEAAGGAVSGAIVAATGGASLFVQGAISNAGGGIVTRAIETGSLTKAFEPQAILNDAVSGAAAAGLAKVGATVASKATGAVKSLVSRAKVPSARVPPSGGGINLASPQRTEHILHGDATGGGHLWPGKPGKTPFPKDWSGDKIMEHVSDVATDPKLNWVQQTGKAGSLYTKAGKAARFTVSGEREGVQIKVVIEPAGEGIITGHPH